MNAPIRLTDRKRLAILAAASEQFRTSGFDASSMDKIALEAGVSKRTVYNHFPCKEELFTATVVETMECAAAEIDTPYVPGAPLRAQLAALLERKLRIQGAPDFIGLARVAIAEAVHAPERARPMIARLSAREEGLTVWIRAAQADGALTAGDPVFASTLLQGQLKAVAFWPQVTLGAPPLDAAQQAQLVETAVAMFLGYFGTRP